MTLKKIRQNIDRVDAQLQKFLQQRARYSHAIAKIKQTHQQPILRPKREQQILNKVAERPSAPFSNSQMQEIFKTIFAQSRQLQNQNKSKQKIAIKTVTIIGLGLIGSSIARAIQKNHPAITIKAYDTLRKNINAAKRAKIIDESCVNLSKAIQNTQLIIMATPLSTFSTILNAIAKQANPHTIITDVCSVKLPIINQAKKILPSALLKNFVPAHPIAGKETTGWQHGEADLFQNKCVVLTPLKTSKPEAIKTIKQLWQSLGASVKILSAQQHDEILAATSHLPQLLIYIYLQALQQQKNYPQLLQYTGSGFRDFTRIGASNPKWWSEIMLANHKVLRKECQQLSHQLNQIKKILKTNNPALLLKFFRRV